MNLINAQDTGKIGLHELPVRIHTDLFVRPQKTEMHITYRHLQKVIFRHPVDDQLIRHPVTNHGVGNGVAHRVGILPVVRNTGDLGLEILAALTLGLIHTHLRHDPTLAIERTDMFNLALYHPLTFPPFPTLRARITPRTGIFILNGFGWAADKFTKRHGDSFR